jgi:excisionase family DNA binding protein
MDPLLATKKQAAEVLNVSQRTVHNLIARGGLRTRRIGRRVLIPIVELRRVVSEAQFATVSNKRTKD